MWKRGCDVPKNANRKRDNQTGLSVSALPVYMLSAMVLRSFQDIGESFAAGELGYKRIHLVVADFDSFSS